MNHNRFRGGFPLRFRGRVLLAAGSLFLLGGFAVAAVLSPDPRGYGTHRQFGLPPCAVRVVFGVPCPSCGTTTSFAHFVRGEWDDAVRANAAGFLLALGCAGMVLWCWVSAARGRMWLIERPLPVLITSALLFAAISLLHWTLKLFVL